MIMTWQNECVGLMQLQPDGFDVSKPMGQPGSQLTSGAHQTVGQGYTRVDLVFDLPRGPLSVARCGPASGD